MTVDEMLDSMPSTEIPKWRAFFKIDSETEADKRIQKNMANRLAGKKGRRAR